MAKEIDTTSYEFTGLPFNDIIGKPLIAVARAQGMMAREQIRSLLDSCFHKHDGVYEPILLKMTVTRSAVEPGKNLGDAPTLDNITTVFYLPLITIFPINSLAIEHVDLDFSVDIVAQYSIGTHEETAGDFLQQRSSSIEWLGKINRRSAVPASQESEKHITLDGSASFNINVEAGPLPLPKGLTEIINLYTNSLQVVDLHDKKQETL